jgi:hypothetical protein
VVVPCFGAAIEVAPIAFHQQDLHGCLRKERRYGNPPGTSEFFDAWKDGLRASLSRRKHTCDEDRRDTPVLAAGCPDEALCFLVATLNRAFNAIVDMRSKSYRYTLQTMSEVDDRRQKQWLCKCSGVTMAFEAEVRQNLRATTASQANLRFPRGKLSEPDCRRH